MNPGQRKTKSQTRQGRAHQALRTPAYTQCPNCGDTKRHHAACPGCGYVRPGLALAVDKEK
jgi:large subunit ribosomal protein L32